MNLGCVLDWLLVLHDFFQSWCLEFMQKHPWTSLEWGVMSAAFSAWPCVCLFICEVYSEHKWTERAKEEYWAEHIATMGGWSPLKSPLGQLTPVYQRLAIYERNCQVTIRILEKSPGRRPGIGTVPVFNSNSYWQLHKERKLISLRYQFSPACNELMKLIVSLFKKVLCNILLLKQTNWKNLYFILRVWFLPSPIWWDNFGLLVSYEAGVRCLYKNIFHSVPLFASWCLSSFSSCLLSLLFCWPPGVPFFGPDVISLLFSTVLYRISGAYVSWTCLAMLTLVAFQGQWAQPKTLKK